MKELGEYDGKSTVILGEIAHRWSEEPDYLVVLLDLFVRNDPTIQNGATWLFKSSVETNASIGDKIPLKLSKQAISLNDWAAQLHVCQSVQHLTFASTDAHRLGNWLRPLLRHNRPFLRAWSLDALVHLSTFDSELQRAARTALAEALADPAASVRARARRVELAG